MTRIVVYPEDEEMDTPYETSSLEWGTKGTQGGVSETSHYHLPAHLILNPPDLTHATSLWEKVSDMDLLVVFDSVAQAWHNFVSRIHLLVAEASSQGWVAVLSSMGDDNQDTGTDIPSDYYSLEETASLLGISQSMAASWCEMGQIEAYQDEAGTWHVPSTQFVMSLEESRKAERFFSNVELQLQEAGWPEMTDEEFLEMLQHNDEDASTGE